MFNVLSDIHLERIHCSHQRLLGHIASLFPPTPAKYLLLAGDIGDPYSSVYWFFLHQASRRYSRVFMVTGNKEYGFSASHPLEPELLRVNQHIHETLYASGLENIDFLDERYVELDECIVIGTTLWTIPHSDSPNKYTQNDSMITSIFHRNVSFLQSTLSHLRKNKKPILLLTHFAPTTNKGVLAPGSEDDGYHTIPLHQYVSSLSAVKWFVYGHTHYNPLSNRFISHHQHYICNQVGPCRTHLYNFRSSFGFSC